MQILKKLKFVCLLLFLYCANGHGQEYLASDIPDSLKTNACAVVRKYLISFSQKDLNNGTYKVTKVVTILNKDGDEFANFGLYDDKFKSLSSFSGILRNASGEVIRKIKKSDLVSSSITTDAGTLASDDIYLGYSCKSPSYPYTVEYTYEQKWKNGILGYPAFIPLGGYSQAVEYAEYTLDIPDNIELRYKANYDCNIKEEATASKSKRYKVVVKNQKSPRSEEYSPYWREVLPLVFFAPGEFCYDSQCGNMSDWKNYGLWINSLLADKDIIPAELEAKLKQMTEGLSSDREKVKVVYEYLQANTRYVNIALGIGGYQPFDASTVYKTNFGDCKALSNYMRAMLKAIGINSNYTLISMDIKDLYKDYPNFNQLNHVILLVPLQNDSIWLECTSALEPFGYVHRKIAGHDALIISEDGGELCRLPSYPIEGNKTITKLEYFLDEAGGINGSFTIVDQMASSEGVNYILKRNQRDEMVGYLNTNLKLSGVKFGEITSENKADHNPQTKIQAEFTMANFANKTGTRFFLPACPLNKSNFDKFKAIKRELPMKLNYGYVELDSVVVNVPEGYVVESLPPKITNETLCGKLSVDVQLMDNKLLYIQKVTIFPGEYDVSKYKDVKSFFAQVMTATKKKIVIKKQE